MGKCCQLKAVPMLVCAWAVACVAAFGAVWVYANAPGDSGRPAANWRPPTSLNPHSELPTLVVFAHPKCPCTRATFNELERLQADCEGLFVTRMVFYEPEQHDDSWREGVLWTQAASMPECESIADPGGRIGMAAGAKVSGTVALYAPDGDVQFWGGITPSRAHEGESTALAALRTILLGGIPSSPSHEVYGCDLLSADECWAAGGVCGSDE